MVILKLTLIGFRGSDDHTVGYRRKVTQFLTGTSEPALTNNVEKVYDDRNGNFKMVVADDIDTGLEIMRAQIAGHVGTVSWIDANLEDFYFEVVTSDVKDGLFWFPSGVGTRSYRVSDGEEL